MIIIPKPLILICWFMKQMTNNDQLNENDNYNIFSKSSKS